MSNGAFKRAKSNHVRIVSIALWALLLVWMQAPAGAVAPENSTLEGQAMMNRSSWWLLLAGAVLAAVVAVLLTRALQTTRSMPKTLPPTAISTQPKREYVLEIIGMGVTLDKYRQGKLWAALQGGNPHATIREQDVNKYPWTSLDKQGTAGGREGDTLENGAQEIPMYWGAPVINAEPPILNPDNADKPDKPQSGLAMGAVSSGMAWHLFVTGPRRFEDTPDRILEDVFAFFDNHPDVPFVILNADDALWFRDMHRLPGTERVLKDGYYIPEMPDSSALFVLARRERVNPVRPFVWDDPDNKFLQTKLRYLYGDLMHTVPHPERTATRSPADVGADMSGNIPNDGKERQPTVEEWLEGAAAFAKRPDVRGTQTVSMLDKIYPDKHRPPANWTPTPWFPIPWNRDQLATFDRLPTLGYLHRPTFVKLVDEHGKPLRKAARAKALQAGWQEALLTLPESQRAAAAARVIAATGGDTAQLITLHSMLSASAENGGPEVDTGKSAQFIDTDKRLGNTGAATLFMQMAIGVMGSYRDGGVSAAINLRNKDEAAIVMISPPSEEKRKTQRHPNGGDVFDHKGKPAIDPADYAN